MDESMMCPRCAIEMINGIAIKPNIDHYCMSIVPVALINAETIKIIHVWKCPQCGHSDDGK